MSDKNMSYAIKRPLLVIAQQLRAYSIQLESMKNIVPDDCPKNTSDVLDFVSNAVIRNTQVPEDPNPPLVVLGQGTSRVEYRGKMPPKHDTNAPERTDW